MTENTCMAPACQLIFPILDFFCPVTYLQQRPKVGIFVAYFKDYVIFATRLNDCNIKCKSQFFKNYLKNHSQHIKND